MQIEQALYGECRGEHSLLASSGADTVSAAIVQRLDLPDTAPPGVKWSPFLRGFPYEDRYVLSRTFHDPDASRGGMVFSHALLTPLDEIGEMPELGPLVKLLATSDQPRPEPTTVRLARTETEHRHTDELVDAAEAFGTNGTLPVVRLDHVGFDDLVVALWVHLSPELRRGFAFRLSFDPRDLVETPRPTLVCTPRGMATRWSEYPVIRSVSSPEPRSFVAAVLSGHGRGTALIEFIRDMGLKPATIPDLRLIEQAYCLDIGEPTFERRVGAVRLIGKLSPDATAGEEGKNVLVRRLCDILSAASAEEVLQLRNLDLAAFPAPSRVWKALGRWMAENSYPPDQDVEMLAVFEDATAGTNALPEWRTAVLNGFAVAIASLKSSFPKAFWRWFRIRPEIAVAAFRHVPLEAEVEQQLTTETPRNLNEAAAKILLTAVLSRGWLRLHGALLSATCSTSDAARRQVAVDTDPSFVEGLRSALRHAKPANLVKCALEVEDPRMPRLAAEAVAKEPRLLAEVDLTAVKTQLIWREALTIDPESWRGPADPVAAFRLILDRLLDGGETDSLLIERLSDTPVADLGTYPRRPEIWSRIRGVALHKLLAATAKGWLREATSAEVPFVPEDDLQVAILDGGELEQALDGLIPNLVGTAVRIVDALGRYEQQQFLRLLRQLTSRTTFLPRPDAEGIGRLVRERRWQSVAKDLVHQYRTGRRDLKPAIRACCDLLDVWERFLLGLTPVSESEKWKCFEQLAVQLYPRGPDDLELWERAGGDDADLSTAGSGRTRWRKAVRNLRNGGGPTAAALLASMMEDFPNNERIPLLARDPVFGGGVPDGLEIE